MTLSRIERKEIRNITIALLLHDRLKDTWKWYNNDIDKLADFIDQLDFWNKGDITQ